MTAPDLLTLMRSDLPVRSLLEEAGRIFRSEFPNDSGNECFAVACESGRLFVKHSDDPRHVAAFGRVVEGMEVVRRIQALEPGDEQYLEQPVPITSIERIR